MSANHWNCSKEYNRRPQPTYLKWKIYFLTCTWMTSNAANIQYLLLYSLWAVEAFRSNSVTNSLHFPMTWQYYSYHNVPGSLGPANALGWVTPIHVSRDAAQHYQCRKEAAQQTTCLHLEWCGWKSTSGICRSTFYSLTWNLGGAR